MLLLPAEQKTTSGRAGFKLGNTNQPLVVMSLFVIPITHPQASDLKESLCSLSNRRENTNQTSKHEQTKETVEVMN